MKNVIWKHLAAMLLMSIMIITIGGCNNKEQSVRKEEDVTDMTYRSRWLQSNFVYKRIIPFVDALCYNALIRYLCTNPSGTKFPCKHSYERMIL